MHLYYPTYYWASGEPDGVAWKWASLGALVHQLLQDAEGLSTASGCWDVGCEQQIRGARGAAAGWFLRALGVDHTHEPSLHSLWELCRIGPPAWDDFSERRYLAPFLRDAAVGALGTPCVDTGAASAAYALLGLSHFLEGYDADARRHCEMALALQPESSLRWRDMAVLHLHRGHWDEAMQAVRTGLAFSELDADCLLLLGLLAQSAWDRGTSLLAFDLFTLARDDSEDGHPPWYAHAIRYARQQLNGCETEGDVRLPQWVLPESSGRNARKRATCEKPEAVEISSLWPPLPEAPSVPPAAVEALSAEPRGGDAEQDRELENARRDLEDWRAEERESRLAAEGMRLLPAPLFLVFIGLTSSSTALLTAGLALVGLIVLGTVTSVACSNCDGDVP